MTASSDSSTAAAALPGRGVPWRPLGLLLLFVAGALGAWGGLLRLRQRFVFESLTVNGLQPIPVECLRLPDRGAYPVHFLLLHGYGANRRHLLQLAEVLAAAGADVYLLDLPGRGDHPGGASAHTPGAFAANMPTPRETQAALAVVRHLEQRFGVRPDRLVVVGHSLGGGVALDVAQQVAPAATISLAGLERPVTPGKPRNLLLVTARLEIPALRRAADAMYGSASVKYRIEGNEVGHFQDGTAMGRREFAITHAWLPFHPGVQRAIVEWVNRALPDAHLTLPPHFNASLLALELAGLFFLAGLFAPLAELAGWAWARQPFAEVVPETRFTLWSPVHLAGYALLAGTAAVSAIHLLVFFDGPLPLGFLRLDGGSYLASVLLLATLWLLPVLARPPWVRSWRETAGRAGVALGLAVYVIVVGGGFITWQLFDLWPTPGRFLRLLALLPLLFPYALGEELLGRTYAKAPRGPSPVDAFLAWRLALLASLLYAALYLGSGAPLLVVMAPSLLLLSLVEYFFSAALYRALGSAYANAVLKTLLLTWIVATVFPLQ